MNKYLKECQKAKINKHGKDPLQNLKIKREANKKNTQTGRILEIENLDKRQELQI